MKGKLLIAIVLLALFLLMPIEHAAATQDMLENSLPVPAFSIIVDGDSEYRILIYETLSEDVPPPLLVQQEQQGQIAPEQNQQGRPGTQPGDQNQMGGQQGQAGRQNQQAEPQDRQGGAQGADQAGNEVGGWGYYWWWWMIIAGIIIFFIIIFAAWGGWGGRGEGRPPEDRI